MIVHPLTDDELAQRHDLVDRDDIDLLVRSFYRYAAMDELLGPIFAEAGVDWPSHIEALTDFWAWQLCGERGYDANPLRAHEPVHARTPFASTTTAGSSCSRARSTNISSGPPRTLRRTRAAPR